MRDVVSDMLLIRVDSSVPAVKKAFCEEKSWFGTKCNWKVNGSIVSALSERGTGSVVLSLVILIFLCPAFCISYHNEGVEKEEVALPKLVTHERMSSSVILC
jgi:hypothetical protein